jgi:serine/threonine-protein kinase
MSACPSSAVLKQLLEAELAPLVEKQVGEHVETCASCQTMLDELTGDDELQTWVPGNEAPENIGAAKDTLVGPGLLRVLEKSQFSAAAAGGGGEPGGIIDSVAPEANDTLAFLGPPRRGEDLGVLGRYDIEAVLGRGAMGIVLRGFDAALDRRVAIKVLRPELCHETAKARFVGEARAAARIRHEHVVSVFAVDSLPDGPPFLAMELLDGGTLAELIEHRGRLVPGEAAKIALEIADGLDAAHRAGLVHRDMKPDNVLLDTASGRCKVGDFGLARFLEQSSGVTQEGIVVGTPPYMSPEQVRGAAPDPRCDVYALGATLYDMLTGEPPFRGPPAMVMRRVLDEEPRPPRRIDDAVPHDLETVCLKAMAKEPARRYQTAAEFADDLRRWLRGEPVRARPAGPLERLWRFSRRKPLVAGLTGALLISVAGGFAAVVWQWRRAEANRAEAVGNARSADEQRALADANFHLARQAVDRFFDRVFREGLLDAPGMQAKRRELLVEMLLYYRAFLRVRGDDPTLSADLASAKFNIATIVQEIGDKAEALDSAREALALYDALGAAKNGDLELLRRAAQCYSRIGLLLGETGKLREGLTAFEQSLALYEQLGPDRDGDNDYRSGLAGLYGNIANTQIGLGQKDLARASFERALPIQERLALPPPEGLGQTVPLARSYNNLAILADDPNESLAFHRQALAIRQRIVDANPREPGQLRELARSTRFVGLAMAGQGDFMGGLAELDAAAAHLRLAIEIEPSLTSNQSDLGELFLCRADLLRRSGRFDDALRDLEEAAEVLQKLVELAPSVPAFQLWLSLAYDGQSAVYRDQGKNADALAAWRKALAVQQKLFREHPDEFNRRNLEGLERAIAEFEREMPVKGAVDGG